MGVSDEPSEDIPRAKMHPFRLLLGFSGHCLQIEGRELNSCRFPCSLLIHDTGFI
ncbi:hypothetical protein D3C87_2061690 [compost metagenome]